MEISLRYLWYFSEFKARIVNAFPWMRRVIEEEVDEFLVLIGS